MKQFRIISSSTPDDIAGAYKAQVRYKFIFWTFLIDISDWRWSISDCKKEIKLYKGEISNVVEVIS